MRKIQIKKLRKKLSLLPPSESSSATASPYAATKGLEKDEIGELVYEVAEGLYPEQAPLITGMILQLGINELQLLVTDKDGVAKTVHQAADTLRVKLLSSTPSTPRVHTLPQPQRSPYAPITPSTPKIAPLTGSVQRALFSSPNPDDNLHNKGAAEGEENRVLFVGGIRFPHTVEAITSYFAQFGNIQQLQIPTDKVTKQRLGYAFIRYDSTSSVDAATRQQFHKINNVMVNVGTRGKH